MIKAIEYLSQDRHLAILIEKFDSPNLHITDKYFRALSKSIIYQQLSGKAADAIYSRFLDLYTDRESECKATLRLEETRLKGIGLSRQKIDYIRSLSSFFIDRGTSIDFKSLSDQQVRTELLGVRGVGDWTVDMFLMFTMGRTDILPYGDLGIKKGFKMLFNLNQIPDKEFMRSNSEAWRPYRTVASCYLWKLVDSSDS